MNDDRVDSPAAPIRTFTVSGAEEDLDALVAARVEEVGSQLAGLPVMNPGVGGVSPQAVNQIEGNCGWSWVELRKSGRETQGQGYLRSGWKLKASYVKTAGAFSSNVLVYSNAALDLWTANFPYSGTSGMEWERDTPVTIPKTQTYGARMNKGSVVIVRASDNSLSTCSTAGPRVDQVELIKK